MARGTSVNYTGALQFTYATTGPDLFKMTDVQQLAQAVELHTHDAVGKGLGVAGTAIKTAIDMPDWFRSTGHTSAFPAAGQGLEMYYDTGTSQGVLQSYNRGGAVYSQLAVSGSNINISAAANSGATSLTAYMNLSYAGAPAAPAITTYATIWPSANPGLKFAAGGTISDYPGGYVNINALTVTPGTTATNTLTVNGPLTVAAANTAVFSGAVTCQSTLSVTGGSFLTGSVSMGAAAAIVWPSGGQFSDGGGGYVAANKLTVTTLAVATLAVNTNVTTPLIMSGYGILCQGTAPVGTGVGFGGNVGQGNGAIATLPLSRGSGFGPASPGGIGWVQFNINGSTCYFPYWT
jgi:hypothetical protein